MDSHRHKDIILREGICYAQNQGQWQISEEKDVNRMHRRK